MTWAHPPLLRFSIRRVLTLAIDWCSLASDSDLITAAGRLGLLEIHEGLASAISSECGAALAHDGLVMDAWPAFPLFQEE